MRNVQIFESGRQLVILQKGGSLAFGFCVTDARNQLIGPYIIIFV